VSAALVIRWVRFRVSNPTHPSFECISVAVAHRLFPNRISIHNIENNGYCLLPYRMPWMLLTPSIAQYSGLWLRHHRVKRSQLSAGMGGQSDVGATQGNSTMGVIRLHRGGSTRYWFPTRSIRPLSSRKPRALWTRDSVRSTPVACSSAVCDSGAFFSACDMTFKSAFGVSSRPSHQVIHTGFS